MMRSLYTAASGMIAQQYNMDTISNNLANVDTAGFKGNQARFQDLVYQTIQAPGAPIAASIVPVGQQVGLGVKVSDSEKIFTQGSLVQTGNNLDSAIEGDGFFQITMPDGTTAYTRDGSFKEDANGSIVTAEGYFVQPQITIPQNAISVAIGPDGTVTAQVPGSAQPQTLGQLQLARFVNNAGLSPTGDNLYSGDRRQRTADRHDAGPQRRGHAPERLSRKLQRAGRQRDRQHDRRAARVRSQLQVDRRRGPDAADRRSTLAVPIGMM